MSDILSHGRYILIVEEDCSIREIVSTLLREEGYETDEATTVPEALERIDENSYDLVLTDLFTTSNQPPRLIDTQVLQQPCHPIPVGILTAWQVSKLDVRRAGFAFLLEKPFDVDELLQRIAESLSPAFTPEQEQQALVIRRSLQALSQGDWETLHALSTPTLCYYPLTRSVFTPERAIIGIDAYLAYAQRIRQHLPGFHIDQVVISQHSKGLVARYRTNWQGAGGERRHFAGSAVCRFHGERISRIGVSQPRARLQALLEQAQKPARV